ncbi:MAG TPA: hypothetical protein VD965_14070 [Burkholderiales bacterium]|nr:hypothetical protein [Burkholderiales bacterium]
MKPQAPVQVHCRRCAGTRPAAFPSLLDGLLGQAVQCADCRHLAIVFTPRGETLCRHCHAWVRASAELSAHSGYAWIACPACSQVLATLLNVPAELARLVERINRTAASGP